MNSIEAKIGGFGMKAGNGSIGRGTPSRERKAKQGGSDSHRRETKRGERVEDGYYVY